MTQLRKKRTNQKRRIHSILSAASCILLLAAVVIVISCVTGVLEKNESDSGQDTALGETGDSGKNKTADEISGSVQSAVEGKTAGSLYTEVIQTVENVDIPIDSGDQPDAAAQDENPSGSTSHTLSNPQISDLASLDNTTLNWGQGVDLNEKNQPYAALSYQEKYGKYNANFIVPDSGNTVYLTFDEGYENGCTPAILNTLKEKNVKAVFFVTSSFAKQNPELIQRMIDEGHMVGNHSVTHPADGLPSQSIEEQQNEVLGLHNYIKENFNYEMHLFRYPSGKFSEQSLAVVNNCNYKSVFWSFAYQDYDTNNQPDPTEALDKLMNKLHPGAIYLLHAVSTTNTEILGDFIDQARAAGYEFVLFD